jgi:hypothetical protein
VLGGQVAVDAPVFSQAEVEANDGHIPAQAAGKKAACCTSKWDRMATSLPSM